MGGQSTEVFTILRRRNVNTFFGHFGASGTSKRGFRFFDRVPFPCRIILCLVLEATNIRYGGAGLILLVLASAGMAAQDSGLPVDQMSAASDFIGVATVSAIDVRKNAQNGMIYTHYALDLGEIWKGRRLAPAELMQAGGTLDGVTAVIEDHDYRLVRGQPIVLFATISPVGTYVVVGIRQGLYEIGAGPEFPLRRVSERRPRRGESPLTLAALKRAVFTTLGQPYQPPAPPPAPVTPRENPAPTPKPSEGEAAAEPPPVRQTPAPAPATRPWGLLVGGILVVAATLLLILSKKNRSGLLN